MPYKDIETIIKTHASNLTNIEAAARLSAQNFLNALEARLFPHLAPVTTPATLFVMAPEGESWKEVPSVHQVMSLQGRVLTFAVGVRFFQGNQVIAKIILPVALTTIGADSDFALGESFEKKSSASSGNYLVVAEDAHNMIGQAASKWKYDRRGLETIVVQ